jgi:hypothetical protein
MRLSSSIVPLLLLLATACASGRTIEERRATIDAEIARGLDKLATVRPDVRTMLEEAPAYAVFSTYDVVLGLGGGTGVGIYFDNESGEHVYLSAVVGLGGFAFGASELYAFVVFEDEVAVDRFWAEGALISNEAGAAAAVADARAEVDVQDPNIEGARIYRITTTGLQAGADIRGLRFEPIAGLNRTKG